MKKRLWKIPAALMVFGLALILAGCPIDVDTRDTDMGGPGPIFGQTPPRGPVTLTITGIPANLQGSSGVVNLVNFGTADVNEVQGSVTVNFQNVPFPAEFSVTFLTLTAGPLQLDVGENTIPWSSFQ